MDFDKNNVTIDHNLHRLGREEAVNDIAHILCEEGQFDFTFDGKKFSLRAHECMIIVVQRLIEHKRASADLKARCIYVKQEYIEMCTPNNNYGIKGALALFSNPIMPLDEAALSVWRPTIGLSKTATTMRPTCSNTM